MKNWTLDFGKSLFCEIKTFDFFRLRISSYQSNILYNAFTTFSKKHLFIWTLQFFHKICSVRCPILFFRPTIKESLWHLSMVNVIRNIKECNLISMCEFLIETVDLMRNCIYQSSSEIILFCEVNVTMF